ncbi:MAG TPA: hypothetical protein VE888_06725 [Streptosporangiaceae bacterium]|nr:hypothetical protein [Streptosporangiaceae bacterium]
MTATVTRGSPASGNTGAGSAAAGSGMPGHRAARRRRPGFPRASTTPGKVRLIRAGLVAACLAWGALAALMVSQHASAAREATATSEPLSLAAQQMYQSLADADVTASTGYLYGRTPPFAYRQRYQRDIAAASADLKAVTAAGGGPAIGASLSTLAADLPVYTGYVEDGQTYNSLGYPAGGSFLEVASEEMHLTLLPAARDVYAYENARLTAASAQATGLPLAVVTLAGGLAVGFALYRAQRWLSRRTHRTLNVGLLLASAAGAVALIWMAVALLGGRADLLRATGHGSTPAETLAQADIAALQARGDETLNLISRTGDTDFQADFRTAQDQLSTLLSSAEGQSAASAAGSVTAARREASSWFAVNQQAQKLDQAHDYGAETQLVIGQGSGSAGALFIRLEADLDAAIRADQAVFADSAAAGSGAFTGLVAGVAVLALAMAAGCAWGLSRRLAEYR